MKTTYDQGNIEFKWVLSLKLNKNSKYENILVFKVCHIKIIQNCKVSNYTCGLLEKLSMHRVHTLVLWHCTRIK